MNEDAPARMAPPGAGRLTGVDVKNTTDRARRQHELLTGSLKRQREWRDDLALRLKQADARIAEIEVELGKLESVLGGAL